MTTTRTITTALAGILLLAGCTSDPGPALTITDPRGTSTATLTTEPAPVDPQQAADLAAIQAYKDFVTAYNQVGQDGYNAWRETIMWPFVVSDDYAGKLSEEIEPRVAAGAHQTGEIQLSDFKIVDRVFGPTGFYTTAVLEACQDSTNLDMVLPNGSSMLRPGTTGRYLTTVEMQQSGRGTWGVVMASTDRRQPC